MFMTKSQTGLQLYRMPLNIWHHLWCGFFLFSSSQWMCVWPCKLKCCCRTWLWCCFAWGWWAWSSPGSWSPSYPWVPSSVSSIVSPGQTLISPVLGKVVWEFFSLTAKRFFIPHEAHGSDYTVRDRKTFKTQTFCHNWEINVLSFTFHQPQTVYFIRI